MADPVWADGAAYEAYVGRWSRLVAHDFLRLLALPPGLRWLDVGCGTGALTATVLAEADPARVTGVDPAVGFLAHARDRVDDPRAAFEVGDARALPVADASVDVVVSGLALNFVPEPARAVAEFVRVLRPGGVAAAYVWDYAEGMAMMRHFWAAAEVLDPAVAERSEGRRFPLCRPGPLRALWTDAGFAAATVRPVVVPTVFADVAAYWAPFLGGQGAAPAYVASLAGPDRAALRDLLVSRLPVEADGSVRLTARAWAVHGTAPS
ncbi:methyltransferase domain-containing protein [Micromonospora halotolerans]|uniref:Methyltransferase domain-containing protein n=1 Tax=Micromonospora halotolerans TaxID=709879 RepID=A0ABY9ZU02_9ACTN|nr:methyltransferase domain-containing protein [Micromonospora halotolerans]WNM38085.1 methyltransferase domain-containing protein [Micromonospora halotolerans]